MSQKSTQSMASEFGTLVRVHAFDRIDVGMTLFVIDGLSGDVERLGTVVSVEKAGQATIHATLDNGQHMTRRGWQSRRLWKAIS